MKTQARRETRMSKQQRFFSYVIAAIFVLIVVSAFAHVPRTALTSPEVEFTDASPSGLLIMPASCPSDPTSGDTPWGCSGLSALCPDGSIAPNNDVTQCSSATPPTTPTVTPSVGASSNTYLAPAPLQPSLTAGSVSPTSAAAGVETVFSATIINSGSGGTGASFTDLLQATNDPNAISLESFVNVAGSATAFGSGIQDIGTYQNPPLNAGQSSTAIFAYTFPSPGTYYMRACADKSSATDPGVISPNVQNKCGPWAATTVTAAATCPDGSIAPSNNESACTCASGNMAACTPGSCPDGSSAPGGNSNQCTCAQGNANQCGGSLSCTDPNNCTAPSTIPGCRITAAPKSARAGNTILVGWASACSSVSSRCTTFGLPETAGTLTLTQSAGGNTQSLGSVPPSGTAWAVPSSVPVTYKVAGQLYAGYWPVLLPVAGTDFSCQFSVASAQSMCADGSTPVNGLCPNNNSCTQTGYPRCSADGSSIEYLDSACHPQSNTCQWAAQGYGCSAGACLTPPQPSASFAISPKLLSPSSTATITWQIGASTACSITASDGDNSSGLTGSGSKATAPILGQTVYTLNCAEDLTGQVVPPQSITVNIVPGFIEK